ncbi:MAG: hypothetical protein FVQ81_12745 [Candidatus Glassbacteria bacterium]|nr:hypothetical protein [Candidatus Glassbacteria bacterium]
MKFTKEFTATLAVFLSAFYCSGSLAGPIGELLPPIFDTLVDSTHCRSAHITTRPHNRKVVYHQPTGRWFLFYGTGDWDDTDESSGADKELIAWRSTTDGFSFSPHRTAVHGNGHSSSVDVILAGDSLYLTEARFGYWMQRAGYQEVEDSVQWFSKERMNPDGPNFFSPLEIFSFAVADDSLVLTGRAEALTGDAHFGHAGPHYSSLTTDSDGYFWVAARAQTAEYGIYQTWVARSSEPVDISAWEPFDSVYLSPGQGTLAPQIIGLDQGKVSLVLFSQAANGLFHLGYDPASGSWSEPLKIGSSYKSKRASAVFDPGSRRLHVVYTDSTFALRHRWLAAPYADENWYPPLSEAGNLVSTIAGADTGDDDLSLSVNPGTNPATLALLHRGPDEYLRLRYYDGREWIKKEINVGANDQELSCDEVSAVADFSQGLAFVYWCRWRSPSTAGRRNKIGCVRFGLIKDVAGLFR